MFPLFQYSVRDLTVKKKKKRRLRRSGAKEETEINGDSENYVLDHLPDMCILYSTVVDRLANDERSRDAFYHCAGCVVENHVLCAPCCVRLECPYVFTCVHTKWSSDVELKDDVLTVALKLLSRTPDLQYKVFDIQGDIEVRQCRQLFQSIF